MQARVVREARDYVAEIGPELALPLARAYCDRWKLPYDPEAGEGMWWAGAFVADGLRAAMGLASLGEQGMIVSGIFTDGSLHDIVAARMLIVRLTELPCELWGTLHLPSERFRRMFRKDGWALQQGVIGA